LIGNRPRPGILDFDCEDEKNMSGKPIWITGAAGLIGQYLLQTAPAEAALLKGLTRADLELTDFVAVRERFRRERPRLVIHCAAMSTNPECHANPALARKVNVEVTALLAELCAEVGFVFFSTDLVFDGQTGNYDETARVNPLGVYAETKAAAEQIVLRNPGHTIIRTSLNGGVTAAGNHAFNEQLRRASESGRTLELFTDEFRCPIPAVVTARAVWELALAAEPGLYHVAGSQRMSRWEIGEALAARWPQLQPRLEPASIRDRPGPSRAPDTSLNCSKAQRLLSFRLPGLSEWLEAGGGSDW
jgi:dTDP-4-dehydrorhamnose reductase